MGDNLNRRWARVQCAAHVEDGLIAKHPSEATLGGGEVELIHTRNSPLRFVTMGASSGIVRAYPPSAKLALSGIVNVANVANVATE